MSDRMKIKRKLEPVVRDLLDLDDATLDILDVGVILTKHNVTASDFLDLDEGPGIWGYSPDDDGREWHWKLRSFRNSHMLKSYRFAKEPTS
jgi:hypothetical protein